MATETEEEDRQAETKALLATRPEEEVQQAGTEALLATGAVPVTNGTARMAKAKMKKRTTTWRLKDLVSVFLVNQTSQSKSIPNKTLGFGCC